MAHLTPEELLDLAEGTRSGEMFPHVASCDVCRRELSELRATLAMTADVAVPEPSPLFWDHLSARVHEAVEAERRAEARTGPLSWPSWRIALPFGVAAVLGIALVVGLRIRVPGADPDVTAPESTALVEATRREAEQALAAARAQLHTDVEAARARLDQDADALANEAASRILGRQPS